MTYTSEISWHNEPGMFNWKAALNTHVNQTNNTRILTPSQKSYCCYSLKVVIAVGSYKLIAHFQVNIHVENLEVDVR